MTESKIELHEGPKYTVSEEMINATTWETNLTITNIQKIDFGRYTCASTNPLGKSEASIRLLGNRFT